MTLKTREEVHESEAKKTTGYDLENYFRCKKRLVQRCWSDITAAEDVHIFHCTWEQFSSWLWIPLEESDSQEEGCGYNPAIGWLYPSEWRETTTASLQWNSKLWHRFASEQICLDVAPFALLLNARRCTVQDDYDWLYKKLGEFFT